MYKPDCGYIHSGSRNEKRCHHLGVKDPFRLEVLRDDEILDRPEDESESVSWLESGMHRADKD